MGCSRISDDLAEAPRGVRWHGCFGLDDSSGRDDRGWCWHHGIDRPLHAGTQRRPCAEIISRLHRVSPSFHAAPCERHVAHGCVHARMRLSIWYSNETISLSRMALSLAIQNPPPRKRAWQSGRQRHARKQRNERMKYSPIENHPRNLPLGAAVHPSSLTLHPSSAPRSPQTPSLPGAIRSPAPFPARRGERQIPSSQQTICLALSLAIQLFVKPAVAEFVAYHQVPHFM